MSDKNVWMYRICLKDRPSNCLYVDFLCDAEPELRCAFDELGQETEFVIDQVLITDKAREDVVGSFEGF